MTLTQDVLHALPLRRLSVDPASHPRGQSFLSAASGLVCRHGRAYVIADDELHLGVFHDTASPGQLHRVLPGELPESKKARKRRKPDLETLLWWPQAQGADSLLALGSGSRASRERAVLVALDAEGEPIFAATQVIHLAALFAPLRERLHSVNIEGAFVLGKELVLLNRGLDDGRDNVALHYRLVDVQALIAGREEDLPPLRQTHHALPRVQGARLNFTDGAALPGDRQGRWIFTAVAEDSRDSVADGAFLGAAIGLVDSQGTLLALRPLAPAVKVEGIDVQLSHGRLQVCLVSDADDPEVASMLLRAHW